jgi:hypothetical protein
VTWGNAMSCVTRSQMLLQDVDQSAACAFLPPSHAATFHTVDADGTRVGLLTA